jgi:hypothetical protein
MEVPTKDVPVFAITREGAGAAWAFNPEEKANMAKVVMDVSAVLNLVIIVLVIKFSGRRLTACSNTTGQLRSSD